MAAFCFINQNIHFPAASEFIGEQYQIKNTNQINNRANILKLQWPNQSLKLTEIAVDDLTRAEQPVTCWTGLSSRGLDSVAAALRRRTLAPVR